MNARIQGPVLVAMLCAFAAMLGYVLGEQKARSDAPDASVSVEPLVQNQEVSLASEPRCAPEPLLECEAARAELRSGIEQLTATQAQLREDLEFYRGLVDARHAGESVRLHRAEWQRLSAGRVVLRLVLVRAGPRQKVVHGSLQVKLRGVQSGDVREVFLDRIAVGEPPRAEFAFQNFHEWEIELQLPESFQAERLIATVKLKGQKTPIVESWNWMELES